MKPKLSALLVSLTLANPFYAQAVVNGTTVPNNEHQQFVEMGCTGTIIGGKWVLTAAHCAANLGLVDVTLYDQTIAKTKAQHQNPTFDGVLGDIAIWELDKVQSVNAINPISIAHVGAGENITMYGFGGTAPFLSRLTQISELPDQTPQWIRTKQVNTEHSTAGDSGSAYLNSAGEIVGIHGGGSSISALGMEGFRTEMGASFILDTINGWHYPTNIKLSSTTTITVQSIHVGGTVDTAFTNGDLTINYSDSTCDDGPIPEFGICTYSLSSTGKHGKLYLSDNEIIEVNKPEVIPPKPDPKPKPNPDNGGGSTGPLFGFMLLAAVYIKRKNVR